MNKKICILIFILALASGTARSAVETDLHHYSDLSYLTRATAMPAVNTSPSTLNTKWGISLRKWLSDRWNQIKKFFSYISKVTTIRKITLQIKGLNGQTVSVSAPLDSRVCDFYQTNKKLVTCADPSAADYFCSIVMQSSFAKAVLCQENGVVVCSNPCHPPEYQAVPKQCAFDNERTRGSYAPPFDFCF